MLIPLDDRINMIDEICLLRRHELEKRALLFMTKLYRNPTVKLTLKQEEYLLRIHRRVVCGVSDVGRYEHSIRGNVIS